MRIDYNKDGRTDYWEIKKDNLVIQVFFQKDDTVYRFRKFSKFEVKESFYFNKRNSSSLLLAKTFTRKRHKFNLSDDGCSQSTPIEKLTLDLPIAPSLDDILINKTQNCEDFDTEVRDNFEPLYKNSKIYADCISSAPDEIFSASGNTREAVVARFNAFMGNLSDGKEEPVFICEGDSFSVIENGPISIPASMDGFKNSTNKFFHEIVHSIDANQTSLEKSEDFATKLADHCKNPSIRPTKEGDKSNKDENPDSGVPPEMKDVISASNETSNKSTSAVPASIAESVISGSEKSNPTNMNRIAASEGRTTTTKISESQTSGLIESANALMGPTPAYAEAASYDNTDYSSRSPASAGSDYKSSSGSKKSGGSSKSEITAKNEVTMPKGFKPSSALKPGEFVTEEIDLTASGRKETKLSAPSTGPAGGVAAKSPTPTSSFAGTGAEAATGKPAVVAKSAAGTPATSPSGNLADVSTPSRGGSAGAGRNKNLGARKPASQSGDNGVAIQIASSFSQDYGIVKNRLKQSSFVEILKENNITVFDLKGNRIGAERGGIIFEDKGDRFVRKK